MPLLSSVFLAATVLFLDAPPIPPPGAQVLARALLREAFRKEFDREEPAERLILAERLLELARETRDDPVKRYVLLKEAHDLALLAGEARTALAALDRLSESYAIDALPMKVDVLTNLSRESVSPESGKGLAESAMRLIEEASAAERYDAAARLAPEAVKLAEKAEDPDLLSRSRALREHVGALEAEHARLESARKILSLRPDDPSSNLALGMFHCFLRGDWERGLPLLARSENPPLKALSQMELSGEKTAQAQVLLGAKWAELAEMNTGWMRKALEKRALHWYQGAILDLDGAQKLETERRVARFLFGDAAMWETSASEYGVVLGGEDHNISRDFTMELWLSTTAQNAILLTKRHREPEGSITLSLSGGCPSIMGDAQFYRVESVAPVPANDGRWHHLAAVKSEARVQLYLDGKQVAELRSRPTFTSRSPWVLGFHGAFRGISLEARFSKIRLSKTARYSGPFSPRSDYGADRDTLLFK